MENRHGSSSNQIRQDIIKHGGQGWYATLTPQQKADYLQTQRIAREEKMAANHTGVNSVDVSHISPTTVANSSRTPFINITNTHTDGTNTKI